MAEQVVIFSGSKDLVENRLNSWLEKYSKSVHVIKRKHLTTVVPEAIGHRIELTVFIYYTDKQPDRGDRPA